MKHILHAPLLVKFCLMVTILIVFAALFAGPLSTHDIGNTNLLERYIPPVFMGGSWAHILGTDNLGRDVLSLTLRAIQVSMFIAAVGTVGGAVIGTTLGLAAAWLGGWVDHITGVLVDFFSTIPFIILAMAALAIMPQTDMGLFLILMVFYGWERYARLARAVGLAAKEQAYIQAQIVIGASTFRILALSILPNAAAVLLVNMSLNFPQTILTETSLNFLGIGIQPPDTSLGVLIGQGRSQLYNAPWMVLVPGLIILLATVCISILGDWARDLIEAE